MARFVLRRLLMLIPFLFLISVVSFAVIQLPPGDFVDTYVRNLEVQGGTVNQGQRAAIEAQYGLDRPVYIQYGIWVKHIAQGDFGNSFLYDRPVGDILKERVPRTVGIALAAMLLTWVIAVPIGIYSALRQYSVWDHLFTFISFVGLAVPGFLLALVLMYVVYEKTGWLVTGMFSPEYRAAPWSVAKFVDMLKNLWLPLLVLAVTSAAGVIRVLRASLLDEVKKQYVTTARSKGMPEWKLVMRYPVRIAINPLISTIGWMLPALVGGEVVVSKVLNIPTTGPVLLEAILSQDMYLTGALVMILSALTVIGTLASDVLLAVVDPRIRYE
ncbi:peptide/nickel transport system permease protein [Kribbella sp. VKM Ac-2527]|uniref:Peptide/nickel transport system permease protein n=1 Tax=Kribbella caucasensis TaxID=2512215 RepID=A0A4R6JFN6_9ACTN|nr:ABC transporter permease [Kribbella sp. VKM Ac-2527]TDO34774.1 peptide/nickel transport system permease protein [Kribbella sp. VKM Ac-2527]